MELYAEIVLPLAKECFTYSVPEAMAPSLNEGMGVMVNVGARKIYLGIVWAIHSRRPPYKTIKAIDQSMTPVQLIDKEQMRLWRWMADYYMCSLGEVMRMALPSALKASGLGIQQFDRERFRPHKVRFVKLNEQICSEDKFAQASRLIDTSRAKAQALAFARFCALTDNPLADSVELSLLEASPDSIKRLVERQIFTVFNKEHYTIPVDKSARADLPDSSPVAGLPQLSPAQEQTRVEIESLFTRHNCVLLHGITASGKTEIYIRFIAQTLLAGGSVLYLVPEIAITTQLVRRIRAYFPNSVTLYHSKLTDRQRAESYMRLSISTGGELVFGARSALFLPHHNLQLIIVDEEHDTSYKQSDPAPRYNGRDTAVMLADIYGAKVILGSATPSAESMYNALKGKYGLATISERYDGAMLPRTIVSDTLTAVKKGERRNHFNKVLTDSLSDVLSRGQQAILFQNRRGFAPIVECDRCGVAVMCPHCNVALTLHLSDNRLRCHYCGYSTTMPQRCPECGKGNPTPSGFGTEKIELELHALFPAAKVARLDLDSCTSERAYRRIITDFEQRRTDILVGTQMITKGFDFAGVTLVGVLNADNLLFYPDFRSSERAFQTLSQVSGRAGRGADAGLVIVQTTQSTSEIIIGAACNDYRKVMDSILSERRAFAYPPYTRLIKITLHWRDNNLLAASADSLASSLRQIGHCTVLGPEAPVIDRIKGEFYRSIMIKIERSASSTEIKAQITSSIAQLHSTPQYKYIAIAVDVDPQ